MKLLRKMYSQPTTWLGSGFVTVAAEQLINGNDSSIVWVGLITGLIGMFKNERGA